MPNAKRKTKPSFTDVLSNAAAPAPKKAGRAVKEIITDAPKRVKDGISKVLKAKAVKKAAESDIKVNETPVIDFGLDLKDKRAFSGDYNKSYKIQGKDEKEVITFVTANKYAYKEEDEEDVRDLMGEDNFDELIPETFSINIKQEVFSDPDMQKYFMATAPNKMGNRFDEFYEVTKTRKVIATFDEELYKRFDAEKVEEIKFFVKQAKPAIK